MLTSAFRAETPASARPGRYHSRSNWPRPARIQASGNAAATLDDHRHGIVHPVAVQVAKDILALLNITVIRAFERTVNELDRRAECLGVQWPVRRVVERRLSEGWTRSTVFALMADYREALRIMDAVNAFDVWFAQAAAERARAALAAALGPPSGRLSRLLDLPIVDCCARV
jgi:hypothetical protein